MKPVDENDEFSLIENLIRCVRNTCPNLRLYLAGNVVIVAEKDEDLERFLYATTYPPYIELEKVDELRNSFIVACADDCVAIVDIKSFELSLILSHVLAKALEPYMPYTIDGLDLIVAYRASEDGGIYTRYEIRISIKDRSRSSEICQHINTLVNKDSLRSMTTVDLHQHTSTSQ